MPSRFGRRRRHVVQSLARVFLTNCVFNANVATNTGGALHFTHQSQGTLRNCTLSTNVADVSNGGGIYWRTNARSRSKTPSSFPATNPTASARAGVSANYSCLQESAPGSGNIVTNPMLNAVTLWLQPRSPCIERREPGPVLE